MAPYYWIWLLVARCHPFHYIIDSCSMALPLLQRQWSHYDKPPILIYLIDVINLFVWTEKSNGYVMIQNKREALLCDDVIRIVNLGNESEYVWDLHEFPQVKFCISACDSSSSNTENSHFRYQYWIPSHITWHNLLNHTRKNELRKKHTLIHSNKHETWYTRTRLKEEDV